MDKKLPFFGSGFFSTTWSKCVKVNWQWLHLETERYKCLSKKSNVLFRTVQGVGKANRDLPAGIPIIGKKGDRDAKNTSKSLNGITVV